MVDESARKVALDLDVEHYVFSRNRVDDRTVSWIEDLRLVHQLMINVYGVPAEEFGQVTEAKGQEWVGLLGPAEELQADNKERMGLLAEEADLLRAYNRQYEEFASTHKGALKPIVDTTTTRGSARREVYNAVLYAGYKFDPRKRERWADLEGKLGPVGAFVHNQRVKLEDIWVNNAIKISLKSRGIA